jgi:hypothetical protein
MIQRDDVFKERVCIYTTVKWGGRMEELGRRNEIFLFLTTRKTNVDSIYDASIKK